MNWKHSITVRLSAAFALLTMLVFAVLGIYLDRSADNHMTELDAHELMGKLALVRHVGSQENSPAGLAARLSDALVGEHGVIVTVDHENTPVFSWPEQAPPELAQAAAAVGEIPVRLQINGRDFRVVAGPLLTGWGDNVRVVVARDIAHHTDFLTQLQRDFGLALLAACLLTAFLGVLIVRRGLRPVRAIAQAAGRISAGKLAERIVDREVPPELAEMVLAFNAMLERLEESFSRLSDFSADLAHELRTPIHNLRMQTEVTLNRSRDVDEYRDLLASNLEEYERLAKIIADMLFLAKAEHGLLVPHCENVAVQPLCARLLEYYGLLAENIDIRLSGDAISVAGDRLMLERVIGNLLVNAIHHTPENGSVMVVLSLTDGMAKIAIRNSGPVIPAEVMTQIFDRFVRLDPASEGSGLGLAISRSIARAHQGEITVGVVDGMTEFALHLPGNAAPA